MPFYPQICYLIWEIMFKKKPRITARLPATVMCPNMEKVQAGRSQCCITRVCLRNKKAEREREKNLQQGGCTEEKNNL